MNNIDDIMQTAVQDAEERIETDTVSLRPISVHVYPPRNMSIDKRAFNGIRMFPFIEYEKTYINGVEIKRLMRLQDVSLFLKCLVSRMFPDSVIQFVNMTSLSSKESLELLKEHAFFIRCGSLQSVLFFNSHNSEEIKNSNYLYWRNDMYNLSNLYRLLLDRPVSDDEIVSELMTQHFGCFLGLAESEINTGQVLHKWMFPCHIDKGEFVRAKRVRLEQSVLGNQIFEDIRIHEDSLTAYKGVYTNAYIITARELEEKVFVRSVLLILVDRERGEDSHLCVVNKEVLYIYKNDVLSSLEAEEKIEKFFQVCDNIGLLIPESQKVDIWNELKVW